MLVIKSRGGKKRYVYGGSGMFSSIAKKLFSKAINSAAKRGLAQKVVNAVVNGATNATQKAAENVVKEAYNVAGPHLKKLIKRSSRGKNESGAAKKRKLNINSVIEGDIDINKIIDGSGIVFD